jgi:hypothetical protein
MPPEIDQQADLLRHVGCIFHNLVGRRASRHRRDHFMDEIGYDPLNGRNALNEDLCHDVAVLVS